MAFRRHPRWHRISLAQRLSSPSHPRTSPKSAAYRVCCPFCPLLSHLFSCKYNNQILQLLCFDNDANCPGGGYPPSVGGAKVLLELQRGKRGVHRPFAAQGKQ